MKCSCRIEAFLKSHHRLKVHSIYRHTVNVMADGQLIAFHQENIPLTPLSVSLPLYQYEFALFSQEAERKGMIWLEEEEEQVCLRTGAFNREIGGFQSWEDQMHLSLTVVKRDGLYNKILSLLGKKQGLQGFSDSAVCQKKRKEDSLMTAILREKTGLLLAESKEEGAGLFQEQIFSLIGLGQGLTPSGDDFLTGLFLAFLICPAEEISQPLAEKKEILFRTVKENLDRTNEISRAYLLSAMQGRFGENYHALLASEKEISEKETEALLEKISQTGHSSGIDTLNGLAVGLELIRKEKDK